MHAYPGDLHHGQYRRAGQVNAIQTAALLRHLFRLSHLRPFQRQRALRF